MAKLIEIDGKYYRTRKGKLVEIPPQWLGKVTYKQTIRKRPAKWTAQQRRNISRNPFRKHDYDWKNYRKHRYE